MNKNGSVQSKQFRIQGFKLHPDCQNSSVFRFVSVYINEPQARAFAEPMYNVWPIDYDALAGAIYASNTMHVMRRIPSNERYWLGTRVTCQSTYIVLIQPASFGNDSMVSSIFQAGQELSDTGDFPQDQLTQLSPRIA